MKLDLYQAKKRLESIQTWSIQASCAPCAKSTANLKSSEEEQTNESSPYKGQNIYKNINHAARLLAPSTPAF